jgi:CheY-like chemotaxis protein/HPt (histidine-containing phosphotransfer) domain-containing protein
LNLAYLIDDQTPGAIVGDVTRLRQILINLLSNAVKFTEQGEVVVLVSSHSQEGRGAGEQGSRGEQLSPAPLPPGSPADVYELHFAVKDTGIGIPPDRMDRLFQSFSQVDASTTRRYGGTGLGLAISKRLAEMMGGAMWAESEGIPGHGTTFHFTVQAEAAQAQARAYLSEEQPELRGKRLLIVDDNTTNRRILIRQAESWGMRAQDTASPAEALAWLHQGQHFDIAILDMQMPEMDGLTLATEIRRLEEEAGAQANSAEDSPKQINRKSKIVNPKSRLPLIMLTSLGERELKADAVDFAAFLTKPIKASQLYNALIGVFAGHPGSAAGPEKSKSAFDPHMAERHPLRILLAEDNTINQKLAVNMLARLGYRADVVGNGLEVLEALSRQTYDVIFMDVQMPEMDGLEASRQIHQRYGGQHPRIVAVTANATVEDQEMCLAAGMDDYVSKPIRPEALINALNRCSSPLSSVSPSPEKPPANSDDTPFLVPMDEVTAITFDRTVLQELQNNMDSDFAMELIGDFYIAAPQMLAAMRHGLERKQAEELRRIAHTLKSNSASLGVMRLAELCQRLEANGKADVLDESTAAYLAQAEAEYDKAQAALEAVRQELADDN